MTNPNPTKPTIQKRKVRNMAFSDMIGRSRRLTLTYIVLIIWVAMAVFAILVDSDLYALAVYFASGLPLILGYLWSETSRPTARDAADIIKGIGMRPGNNNMYGGGYNNYGGGFYGGSNYGNYSGGYNGYGNDFTNVSNVTQIPDTNQLISIYSDDATVELKVNQNQLLTLKNIGYVDMIGDKYTFKKNQLDQIKSLVDDNMQDPSI